MKNVMENASKGPYVEYLIYGIRADTLQKARLQSVRRDLRKQGTDSRFKTADR